MNEWHFVEPVWYVEQANLPKKPMQTCTHVKKPYISTEMYITMYLAVLVVEIDVSYDMAKLRHLVQTANVYSMYGLLSQVSSVIKQF